MSTTSVPAKRIALLVIAVVTTSYVLLPRNTQSSDESSVRSFHDPRESAPTSTVLPHSLQGSAVQRSSGVGKVEKSRPVDLIPLDAADDAPAPPLAGKLTLNPSHVMFQRRNVVLTTFWAERRVIRDSRSGILMNQSFYHGRSVPSFDWVVVFLVSLLEVVCPDALLIDGPPLDDTCDLSVVLFCDAATAQQLTNLFQTLGGKRYRQVLQSQRIFFVVVRGTAAAAAAAKHDDSDADSHVVYSERPAYVDAPWAASVPNGANNFRFGFYRDWLETHPMSRRWDGRTADREASDRDEAQVLISDNTDVVFQMNPFAVRSGCFGAVSQSSAVAGADDPHQRGERSRPWVAFTLEDARRTFHNEKYNRRWMSCYGRQTLASLSQRRARISCAGLTFGSGSGMLAYTAAQVAELTRPSLVRCASSTIGATLDQATHNALLHHAARNSSLSLLAHTTVVLSSTDAPQYRVERRRRRDGGVFVYEHDRLAPFLQAGDDGGHEAGAATVPVPPCVFHGNFGTPSFASVEAVWDSEHGVRWASLIEKPADESAKLRTSRRTWLVDSDGVPFVLVHQYTSNRLPSLMQEVTKRYLTK